MKEPLIIVGGMTACKKSDSAVELALLIGGEIISSDSMQVYRGMDIGTAKIKKSEMRGIPHHLIDVIDPDEEWNVQIFQKKAKECIADIRSRGHLPVIAGGTGFYINSLIYDNDFAAADDPAAEENIRQDIRNEMLFRLERKGAEGLHEELAKIDPKAAESIHPNNIKRVMRAIEFYRLYGKKISEHNAVERLRESPYNYALFILNMPREKLYERIEQRVDKMFEEGLEEEARELFMRYPASLVSMQGLGYKEFIPYFNGKESVSDTAERIKIGTRHFAKRQITWFKNRTDGIWLNAFEKSPRELAEKMAEILRDKKII
ncbi:MAG: tRNA (adenosine(37)-N6)-dimethylallyltransferase MiaA [Firmicutes bacterium]|nr:tRNA (adenosine(37)-N6)-dimethylallyltransferase MiaA [Bacillota bacterium]